MSAARRWKIETLPDGVRIVLQPRRTAMRSVVALLTPAGVVAVLAGVGFLVSRAARAAAQAEPPLNWALVAFLVALSSWLLFVGARSLREASWYLGGSESLRLTDRTIEHRLQGPGWCERTELEVRAPPRVVAVDAFDGPRAIALFVPPFFRPPFTWPPWRVLPRRHRDRYTWESFLVVLAPETTVRFGVDILVTETSPLLADLRAAAPPFASPPGETGVRE